MKPITCIALLACVAACTHTAMPTRTEPEKPIIPTGAESQIPARAESEPRKSYADSGCPRFGEFVGRAGDVNGDGVPDLIVGDPAGWDMETSPMIWILSGKDGTVLLRFRPRQQAIGPRVDGGVDVDGDGVPDFFVTLQSHHAGRDVAGYRGWVPDGEPVLCLVSGKSGSTLHSIPIKADIWSNTDWCRFIGDFDRDGVRDIGVLEIAKGAPDAALVLYAGRSGEEIARISIERECSRTYGGFVDIGDVNRDGIADFAVLLGGDTNCPATLRLYSGAHRVPLWEHRLSSLPERTNAVLTVPGDMDGDGVNDIAVSWNECVEVISGHAEPLLECRPDHTKTDTDGYGAALADLGDIDGDGVPDFAVTDTDSGLDVGLVSAKSGSNGRDLWCVRGGDMLESCHFGYQAAAIGDIDGDGITDLVIGCHHGACGFPGSARVLSGVNGSEIFSLRRNGSDVVVERGSATSSKAPGQ